MTVREIALRLLTEYELGGKYVNLSLSSHAADKLSREERAFLTVLLYTTVERKLNLDYRIAAVSGRGLNKLDPNTLNILRLGFCQIIFVNSVPSHAAVNETVKLARGAGERSFVNGVLRAAARMHEAGTLPLPEKEKNPVRHLSVRESFPAELVKLLVREYGFDETERMLVSFNTERNTDITVNTLKISREDYLERLKEQGIAAKISPLSTLGIRISSSVDPKVLPGFDEGLFFVQDASCALSAEVLGAKAGELIADVCAAPGGKSFSASILSGAGAQIFAFDLHESKLSLIEGGAKRLGLENIRAEVSDSSIVREELVGRLDGVICDVPCSGLGVLSKKPDLRYNATERSEALPALQYSILKASSAYLKAGGRLVYSTCTLAPRENSGVVERFLEENPHFRLKAFSAGGLSSDGMLTLLPHIHGTDGFFIALLEKTENSGENV